MLLVELYSPFKITSLQRLPDPQEEGRNCFSSASPQHLIHSVSLVPITLSHAKRVGGLRLYEAVASSQMHHTRCILNPRCSALGTAPKASQDGAELLEGLLLSLF